MSRQRFIHPEFFSSEDLGRISRDARLLFAGLFTLADDYGRGKAAYEALKSSVFPYDVDLTIEHVSRLLQEVCGRQMVRLYEVEGSRYYQVVEWDKYQQPKYKAKPKVPQPQRNSYIRDNPGPNPPRLGPESGQNPETGINLGLGFGRVGKGREGSTSLVPPAAVEAHGLSPLGSADPNPEPDDPRAIAPGREDMAEAVARMRESLNRPRGGAV